MNRRLSFSLALAFPLLLLAPAQGHGQSVCGVQNTEGPVLPVPTVIVCANDRQFNIPNVLVDGKRAILQKTTVDLGGGASFTVGASFNSDPFANFTFASFIPGGFPVTTFTAYFSTPVIGGPYNTAHSFFTESLNLTTPIGAGPGSGTIGLGLFPTYLSGYTNLGVLGVDVGTGTCALAVASTTACPSGDKTNTFGPINPSLLTARLSYSQGTTGVGALSTVTWEGGVELTNVTTTVPEPTSVALMSVGLLLLGGAVRQKRKHI